MCVYVCVRCTNAHPSESGALDLQQLVPIAFTLLHDLSDNEFSLRSSASVSLTAIVNVCRQPQHCTVSADGSTVVPPPLITAVMHQAVMKGLKSHSELARKECVAFFCCVCMYVCVCVLSLCLHGGHVYSFVVVSLFFLFCWSTQQLGHERRVTHSTGLCRC